MAETKILEREYVIPLRRAWILVPQYRRTGKAVKAIKIFIAKHMKVPERDVDNVKLNVHFNNELWFRGRANPPSKVKVKAKKEGDIVQVTFAETPQIVAFKKLREMKRHMPSAKKETPQATTKPEEKKEEQTPEQKKDEQEKEKSVEQANVKQATQQAKAQKHTTKVEKAQHPQRMALKK